MSLRPRPHQPDVAETGGSSIGAVTSSASVVQPELTVRPDFARAADLGVGSSTYSTLGDASRVGLRTASRRRVSGDRREAWYAARPSSSFHVPLAMRSM